MAVDDLPHSLDDKTKALPQERFANAGEVRDFANLHIRADEPRGRQRQTVQGMVDGNRPVPQGVMNAQQQGWRGNVNYREGEGQVSSQRTPYYDLATENDPCLEIELDYGRGQQRTEWERTIAKHLHWMIHEWEEFDWHLQLQQSEMVVHGWGSHLFLSAVDWRPSTWPMRHVLFPDRTRSCLGDGLEAFVVREPLKAHQLYRTIRNEKSASSIGWKVSNVKEAIVQSRRDGNLRNRNAEDFQSLMKNNDLGFSHNASKEVWLNHVFVREFEGGRKDCGGLSHYIIEEGKTEYLFKRRNRFDGPGNVVKLFPYDIGSDGTIHSVRGLGVRIYPFIELSNRLKNHMVDSVLIGSGVLLTSKGTVDLTKLSLTSVGPMKLLPPGVEPANYKVMALEQGPLALSRELQQTSDENNKVYRQSISNGASQARTATEINQDASDTNQLQKSAHNMYYRGLDSLYTEMSRRACNPNYTTMMAGGDRAVEFQRRCLRDGVPKAALAKIVTVKAVRALGAGSAMQRIIVARELMQNIYPGADEVSRHNIKRDYVAALTNSRAADRYVPPQDEAMAPDNDDSIAVLENDALMSGGEALVNTKQNHFKHAMRHLQKAAELLQQLQQGADPAAVLRAWEALGPHIASHLAYLQQDPTRKMQFAALEQQFTQLSKFADKLNQHLQEKAAADAETQAAQTAGAPPPVGPYGIPELDIEWQKMKGTLEIKYQKMQGDLALKAAKQRGDAALKDAETAGSIRRDTATAGAGIAMDAASSAAQQSSSIP